MKKILLSLLFAALMVPWVTQSKAQCDNNAAMCPITIEMYDDFGDGWNGASLEIYQDTILRGTVTLSDGAYASEDVNVCPDSIRLVWVSGSFDEEITLAVYSGTGDVLYNSAAPYADGQFATVYSTCPTCIKPLAFRADSITSSEIFLSWTDNANAAWVLEYGPVGFTLGSGTAVELSDTTYYIQGLDPNASYDFYLRAVCSATDSSAWVIRNFTTNCPEGFPIPFSESFEGYTSRPTCWIYGSTYSSSYPNINTSSHVSGTKSLYMYNYLYSASGFQGQNITLPNTYLISPGINTVENPIQTLQLKLYMGVGELTPNYQYPGTLVIGVMSDSSDFNTFYPVDTIKNNYAGVFEQLEVSFANYPTDSVNGKHIAICAIPIPGENYTGNYLYSQIYIDDIIIRTAPECLRPETIEIAGGTPGTVGLRWFDPIEEHSSWDVAYGPYGFNPDSIDATQIGTILNFSEDSVGIENLADDSVYAFYVRTNCGGEVSEWRGPAVGVANSYNMATSGIDTIYTCSSYIFDDGGILYNYSNDINSTLVIFPSTEDSLAGIYGTVKLASSDMLTIYNGASTSSPILRVITGAGTEVSVNEISSVGPITLKLRSTASGVSSGFTLKTSCIEAPACYPVADVRATGIAGRSAMLRWGNRYGAGNTPSEYEIEVYDLDNETLFGQFQSTTNYYLVSGLSALTNYRAKVRSVCDDGSNTAWDSVDFRTLCVSGGELTIGNGTSTSSYLPTYTTYNYCYTQQIFEASELNGASQFYSISFYQTNTSSLTRNIEIYMGQTNQSTFASTSDPVPLDSLRLVYSGSHTFGLGWNTINLDSTFVYNGTSNLVIAFDDNTGTWTGGPTCQTHSATSKGVYYYSDTYNPDPATVSSYSGSKSVVSYRNNIILGAPCDATAGCIAPAVHVVNKVNNNFDIVWAAGNDETTWSIDIKESTDSVWTTVTASTTETSHSFTNMNSNTTYNVRVSSICGGETNSSIINVYVPCFGYEVPFAEDFESWSTGSTVALDSCWNRLSNYSSGTSLYPYPTTVNGTKAMYMYAPADNYSAIILPPFDAAANELQVSFRMAKSSTADQFLQVGVITDISDINTFVSVAQVDVIGAYEWHWAEVSLADYAGENGFIAILAPQGVATSTYIDNLEVSLIPSCSPRVTGVTVSDITATTANVTWRASENANYIVEYDTAGFTPGTGIRTVVTDTTYALTNLVASSFYDVYVYNLCENTDTSYASFINTFKTPCSPMAIPFSENFDTWTASSSAEIDMCWDRLSNYPSFSYYPYVSTSYSSSGSNSMYMYSMNTNYTGLVLPEFSAAINTLQLSFAMMKTNTSYAHKIIVGVVTDPKDISTFVGIDTVSASVLNQWELFEIPLNGYTGTGRITLLAPNGEYSYPYIDDVEVDVIPTCPRPRDVVSVGSHTDTIVADWTEQGDATEWQICYGVSPINPNAGEGIIISGITAHPYAIPNLSNDTTYDVYVRSICGPGDTSRWSYACATATPGSYNMPHSGTDTIYMCSGWIFDEGGVGGDYLASANGTLVIYPSTPMNVVSISGSYTGESCCDYLRIYDGAGTSGTELYNDYGSVSGLNFVSTTGPLTIQFTSDGSGQYAGFAFNVQCISNTCPRVQNLDDSITMSTYSILRWDETGPATEWEIEYGPVGFEHGEGTSIVVNTNPYTLDNLTPLTRYDVYVRGICTIGDSAGWQHIRISTKACDEPDIAVIEDSIAGQTGYYPTYSYYNYGYSQQIFLPEEINPTASTEPMNISSVAFQYFYNTEITRYLQIYVGHTTQGDFATTSSWVPDTLLTKVFEGEVAWNNGDDWFEIQFDTAFTYNGVDNLVLAFIDSTGSYTNSGDKYYTHGTDTIYRAMVKYQDDSPILPSAPPAGTRHTYRNNIQFIACGDNCPKPTNLAVEPGSTTVELTWGATGNYEVAYKEVAGETWSDNIEVLSANTYTVTGLQPQTNYEFRVRQVCDSTSTSTWALISTTTLELPCVAPMGFSASNVELTSATVAWTDSLNNQEAWKVAYGYGADASAWDTIDVTTASVNLTNLYSNTEYTVRVKAYCSVEADVTSEWSEAFTFRTATCEGVSNITSSAVTANSATINWTPGASQTKWEISYGMEGVSEANGTKVVVENTPAYTIEGLESDLTYDVYVRTVCAEGVYSAWSNKIQFRTTVGINTASADNVKVQIYPNPANSEATISVDGVNGKVEFVLADMNGRMVVTETINCEGSLVKTIDVSNLAKGAYFVHIYNDDFNTTRKLIVK